MIHLEVHDALALINFRAITSNCCFDIPIPDLMNHDSSIAENIFIAPT